MRFLEIRCTDKKMNQRSQGNPSLMTPAQISTLIKENAILREEIRVARESAEITAKLVVKQFEETERVLRRFQASNALRKAVLNSAIQVAIIATDQNGLIVVFNKGAENLLGYRGDEVIGIHTPVIFHDMDELKSRASALERHEGGDMPPLDILVGHALEKRGEQQEWVYIRKNGSPFPVSMAINALRNPDGDVEGLLCIASDITEQICSEEALRASERKYRRLVKNIPNIVFKGYADGSIEFFDDKIQDLTGYDRDLFHEKKMKWIDIIVEEDRDFAREAIVEALKSDHFYRREYRIRKKNGDIVWIEAGGQIICNKNGDIDFISGAFLDITERKQAERALHESEEKYRSLFDSGPNPIFILDRKTLRIMDVNPAAIETYGYSRPELLNKLFAELGEMENGEGDVECNLPGSPLDHLMNRRARHRHKDGTTLYIRLNGCPIKYRDTEAVILAATDITEVVEKDAQLFQASKMKTLGEMSAGIAHELNQPLSAIKLGNEYLKLISESKESIHYSDVMKVATEVSEQVDRASRIITRLREFGRKSDFKMKKVSINTPIHHVMDIVEQQYKLQNIHVVFEPDANLPAILADRNQLEQVVFNMLTNARDSIEQRQEDETDPAPGLIRVRSFQENGQVAFSVSDTGTGIAQSMMDKIYEPFFTTKEVGRGMGLGLSIVYGIVRDFGGRIDVKTREGSGTTFTFTFPPAPG